MTQSFVSTPGKPGAPGTPGTPGTNGATWWSGSGNPAANLGSANDLYLDEVAPNNVWRNLAGIWTIITQVQGAPGANGAPGTPGTNGTNGAQGIPGQGARWVAGTSHKGFVASRGKVMTMSQPSIQYMSGRSVHFASEALTSVAVVASTFWVSNSGNGELPTGGTAILKHAIEYPLGGAMHPVTWNGGQATITMQDFCFGESDALSISIPAGAAFAVVETRNCPNGGIIFSAGADTTSDITINSGLGDCFEFSHSALPDRTLTPGGFTSSTGGFYYKPIGIVAMTTRKSYVGIGDSRFEGLMDDPTQTYIGEFERAIQAKYGWCNMAKSGETIATAVVSNCYNLRAAIARRYATDSVCNYGVNDLIVTGNFGVILANLQSLRRSLSTINMFQTTIETETSDGVTNTVVAPNMGSARVAINSVLRAGILTGPGMFDGVYDVAGFTESALNSGLWHAGWTADGYHLNATGEAAMQAAGIINIV